MKLSVFIVSKDRPLQFHTAISSIRTNFSTNIPIFSLVKWSNDRYKDTYYAIYREFREQLRLWPESNFHDDFINNMRWIKDEYPLICGFTDDTIWYRKFNPNKWNASKIFENDRIFTFSLRLGNNTTEQDPEDHNKKIILPVSLMSDGPRVWDWYKEKADYNVGYPISLDGHIYRVADLLHVCEQIKFKNLREWEAEAVAKTRELVRLSWRKELISCPDKSYCVNTPLNFTQPPFHDKVGPFGESLLNQLIRFEEGYRVDLEETFKDVDVVGSHQYISLKYRKIQ